MTSSVPPAPDEPRDPSAPSEPLEPSAPAEPGADAPSSAQEDGGTGAIEPDATGYTPPSYEAPPAYVARPAYEPPATFGVPSGATPASAVSPPSSDEPDGPAEGTPAGSTPAENAPVPPAAQSGGPEVPLYGTPPEPADNPYAAPPAYGTPPAAPPAYGGAPSYGTPPAGPAYGASQGPYGAWPTDPYATPPRTSSPQATWSLVLGILGIVLACGCSFVGFAAAVPAILLGNRVKSDAARGLVVANVSVARAGVILGWVGVGLALLRTLGYLASVTQNSM